MSNPMPKTYSYIRQETGAIEYVKEEAWQWEAIYQDLTSLKQFDDEGHFHQLREIDSTKLVRFTMFSPSSPQFFDLHFDSKRMKLIHLYRHIVLNYGTKDEMRIKLYAFGFETLVRRDKRFDLNKQEWVNNDVSVKVFNVIMPSGELIMTTNMDTIEIENPLERN